MQHTGWRYVDDHHWFLTASGALGVDGLDRTVRVDLGNPRLSSYQLPDPAAASGDELRAAVIASLDLRHLAPLTVMAPLLAATYRAALPVLPNTSVFLVGPGGSFKTAVSALMCQHFGRGLDVKGPPADWRSTAKALEVIANVTADVLLGIDDYTPLAADQVLRRTVGNGDRVRLHSNGVPRPAGPGRAQIIASGEVLPAEPALRARLTITELGGDDVDRDRLVEAQRRAADGVYALAMAGYIRWLAGHMDTGPGFPASLQRLTAELRPKLTADGQPPRAVDAASSLLAGWTTWLRYATDLGAISRSDSQQILAVVFDAMTHIARRQAAHAQ